MRLLSLLPRVCGPAGCRHAAAASGGRGGCAALAAPRAPAHEPHDDEDDHRNQPDDEEHLDCCEDPAHSRDDKPDDEDRAEDCPDDPAHVTSMRLVPLAGGGRAGPLGPGPGRAGRLACPAGTALDHRRSQPSRRQACDYRRPARASGDVLAAAITTCQMPQGICAPCPAARAALRGITQDPGALG
jgi:hypothetical protein